MQYLVFFFFAEYENLVGSIENNETLMFMTYHYWLNLIHHKNNCGGNIMH